MRGRLLIGACVALGLLVAGGLLIAAPGKDVQPVLAPSTLGGCWTLLPPAALGASNGTLADLATLTSQDVWAVGGDQSWMGLRPLVEHWDGKDWTVVPVPQIDDATLARVVAFAPDDLLATGACGDGRPLVLHWDGERWNTMADPSFAEGLVGATGVVATGKNQAWAVGYATYGPHSSQAIMWIAHWDGARWTRDPQFDNDELQIATGGRLDTVLAVSPNDLWAVGSSLLHGNGSTWTTAPFADPRPDGEFYGAAAIAADDVWAVGDDSTQTRIAHWDGRAWSAVASPNPGGTYNHYNHLSGVAALGPADIWAIGAATGRSALILHWDGRSWSVVDDTLPAGLAGLGKIVAAGPNDLWMTGFQHGDRFAGTLSGAVLLRYTHSRCPGLP